MPRKLLARVAGVRSSSLLALTLALAAPGAAEAFLLGEIRVHSALGEPFRAEIPFTLGADEEATGELSVAVAAPADYQVMELSRPVIVGDLTLKLSTAPNGERRIDVRSTAPVRDPFFNLLVKSAVGRGSHFRAYRVFLDLPASAAQPAPAPRVAAPATRAPAATASTSPREEGSLSATRYGPVRPGESLSAIARKLSGRLEGSPSQIMAALWARNKSKFVDGNMHGLPAGVVFDLPEMEEVRRMDEAAARALLESQRVAWAQRSQPPSAATPAKPPAAEQAAAKPPVVEKEKTAAKPPVVEKEKTAAVKPPAAEKPAPAGKVEKDGGFGMRLTVESGAREESVATAPAADSGVALQMAESMQKLQTLTERLEESNQKLLKAESERDALKNKLSALLKRMETLEKEQEAARNGSPDWLMLGVGAGIMGLMAAGMAWMLRRRNRERGLRDDAVSFDLYDAPAGKETAAVAVGMAAATVVATVAVASGGGKPVVDDGDDAEIGDGEEELELAGPVHLEGGPAWKMPVADTPRRLPPVAVTTREPESLMPEESEEDAASPFLDAHSEAVGSVEEIDEIEEIDDVEEIAEIGGEIGSFGGEIGSFGGEELAGDLTFSTPEIDALEAEPGGLSDSGRGGVGEALEVLEFNPDDDGEGSGAVFPARTAAAEPVELEVIDFNLDGDDGARAEPLPTSAPKPKPTERPGVVELDMNEWPAMERWGGDQVPELSDESPSPDGRD